jgi:beta-lactamase superfamily II metal-dependent hydrolase
MRPSRKWLLVFALAVVFVVAWSQALVSRPGTLELTYLDVGEGLCGVMRTPSGKTVVFDCGTSSWRDSAQIGSKLVATYLQQRGVDRIDLAVLSHPHADHVSGYAALLAEKPAKTVLDIGARHGISPYVKFLREVKKSGAKYRIARRGQSVNMGDGVRIAVLSPSPSLRYSDLNERSMVLRVTFGKAAMLLCADVGAETEARILESGDRVRAQVLQVGHHGSKSSSTAEWLAAVRPRVAIISCGRGDSYGHPSRDVLARLSTVGARVYRTDRHGAVTVTTDGRAIRVRAFGQSQ